MCSTRVLRCLVALFLFGSALGGARLFAADCAPGTFRMAQVTAIASSRIAWGYVDGDAKADLVASVSVSGQNAVQVFPGIGDGTFENPITRLVPGNSFAFSLGDFDGDGKIDLVNLDFQKLSFFKGNGDGTFEDPIDTATTFSFSSPMTIQAVDLTSDGKLDLIAISQGALEFFRGNGNGTFVDGVLEMSSVSPGPAFADFDGDGKPDIVVAGNAGRIEVALGAGDGSFGPPEDFVAGKQVSSVATGDFDGDGKADVVASVQAHLAFLKGLGDGTFLASVEFYGGANPSALVVSDFDLDGKLDLAVSNVSDFYSPSGSSLSVLFGNGDGTFSEPFGFLAPASLNLAAADFNGDGLADIAGFINGACCSANIAVSILLNDGSRTFEAVSSVDADVSSSLIASGDVNGDGRPDLIVGGAGFPSRLRVLLGDRRGVFHPAGVLFPIGAPASLALGDLNGDGFLDLVVSKSSDSEFEVYIGVGDGTFHPSTTVPTPNFSNGALAIADFDHDGHGDVALASGQSFPAEAVVTVFRGHGDGTFEELASPAQTPFVPAAFVVSDLDQDGNPDLIGTGNVGNDAPNTFFILRGQGDATFAEAQIELAGTNPLSAAVGDFDQDGALDIAVANAGAGTVSILFGNGDGSFAPNVQIGLAWDPAGIAVADFDGDGHLDFATANPADLTVGVARGLGNGSFHSPQAVFAGTSPSALAVGDFDANGTPDLAAITSTLSISILLSAHLSTSSPASIQACGGDPAELAVDANGYGTLQYQWRKDGTPLSDGGNVTGSHTSRLEFTSTSAADDGQYDVLVTDFCGTVGSAAATLSTFAKAATPIISAPLSVSPGATGVAASVPNAAGHAYQWSVTGGTITAGQGTHQIAFTAGPAGTKTMLAVVDTPVAGCESDPGNMAVLSDFLDVPPSHLFHNAIVAIARAGIASGCGAGRFCPDQLIRRSEIAVFVLRGEHGGAYQPPAATGTMFGDVSTSTFLAKWIEQFGSEGITSGCGGGNFCPNQAVSRDAIAVFLLRGKHGSAFDPPAATGTVFGDVSAGTLLAKWMEELSAEGISTGCGGGNFCPLLASTRGEMAALIKKTFGL